MERIIKWFISNTVAANMLMFIILVAGTLTLPRLKMEVFPDINIDAVTITVPYPGSSPSDVEEGICFLIEENLQGLKGVKRITSLASENLGITTVEFLPGEDINQIQDKIKSRIDAIDNFPDDAEKPIIQNISQTSDVITVAISGDIPEESLVSIADSIKDEIGERSNPTASDGGSLGWTAFGNTYGPTDEHMKLLSRVKSQLKKVKKQLSPIINSTLPVLRNKLIKTGAPWIEGQGLIKD